MVHLGLHIMPRGTKSGFCRQGGWGTDTGRQIMSCLPQGVSGRELRQVPSKTTFCGGREAGGWEREGGPEERCEISIPPVPESICGITPSSEQKQMATLNMKQVPTEGGAGLGRRRRLLGPWAAQQTQERNFCTRQCCQKSASGRQPIYVPLETRPPTWKSRTTENLNSFSLLGLWDLTRDPHGCCNNLSSLPILDTGTVPLHEEKPLDIGKDFLFSLRQKKDITRESRAKMLPSKV